MKNYDEIVRLVLDGFCSQQDEVACIHIFEKPNQTCTMCGHHPITWNFVLCNLSTGDKLVVGSECVMNFSRIVGRPLFFPKEFERAANFINQKSPNSAKVAEADVVQMLQRLHISTSYQDEETEFKRSMYDDLGLDPDNPNLFDLAPDGLDPRQFDWESYDYE